MHPLSFRSLNLIGYSTGLRAEMSAEDRARVGHADSLNRILKGEEAHLVLSRKDLNFREVWGRLQTLHGKGAKVESYCRAYQAVARKENLKEHISYSPGMLESLISSNIFLKILFRFRFIIYIIIIFNYQL
jgi:hypothetical protein